MDDIELDSLAMLYSAVVSDSCDRLGMRNQTAAANLTRQSGSSQSTVIGWARTARSVATETIDGAYAAEIRYVDSLEPGDVVVAEVEGDDSAFWGELFSAAAMGRGARGAIIDGMARDVERTHELGFPIFATGSRPTDCLGRIAIIEQDEPVSCGGVSVATGDLVVADTDGVVFVPREAAVQVIGAALEKARTESDAKELLLAGGTLADVWKRHRVL
jgi:4-hydroxy-4-methyl-2-oxoglutarate aldolase